ncbi:BTAD domain-containing putative transcriptional regulator [Streptomyces sp. NPDC002055]|uniref:BTAD domain-containing putative transcriptional regulator n=1 Tax=Streptomyces sp. NPDC002055 TaxID=3154534 RepID=UPI00331FA7D5
MPAAVSAFGTMTVRLPGGPLQLGPPRRRAVLALLLINAGKVVPVSSMARSIWESGPPDQAVATLQSYVSRLRGSVATKPLYGGGVLRLEYRSPGYVLHADPDHVDVMRFERTVERGLAAQRHGEPRESFALLSEALRLWTAPPFEDLAAYEFVDREAERLDQLRLTAVEARADAAFVLGRSEEVLSELESEAVRHPLRERLVFHLMRAQYRSGRQADALRQFACTRQYLADELGADVGPELRRVHEMILRHDPSLAPSASCRSASGVPLVSGRSAERHGESDEPVAATGPYGPGEGPMTSGPFAGRRSELRRLLTAAEAGHRGDGRTVLLVGEAGAGKTRLLREFSRRCREVGTDVVTVHCPRRDDVPPYWPWIQALRRVAARRPDAVDVLPDGVRHVLASLIAEPAPEPDAGKEPQWPGPGRFAFHDAMSQAWLGLSHRPLALVLEDFQWADSASLSLLSFLAGQSAHSRFLLVVTSRTFAVADAPALRAMRAAVLQLLHAEEIRLGALDPHDTRRIVTAVRGDGVDLCPALHERSGGNPYFLMSLLESLPLGATAEDVRELVPTVVREVITERLSGLPPDVLAVLDACAVAGPDGTRGTVDDGPARGDALRRAVRGGLLAVDEAAPDRVHFVHPLVRDVVRQELLLTEPDDHPGSCSAAATVPAPPGLREATHPRAHHVALRAVPSA